MPCSTHLWDGSFIRWIHTQPRWRTHLEYMNIPGVHNLLNATTTCECGTEVVATVNRSGAPSGGPPVGDHGFKTPPLKLTTFYWYDIEFLHLCPTLCNSARKQHMYYFCAKINTFWAGCGGPHPSCPWDTHVDYILCIPRIYVVPIRYLVVLYSVKNAFSMLYNKINTIQ